MDERAALFRQGLAMSAEIEGQQRPESEVSFQDAIIAAARYLGWKVYHTHDSRRSPAGFPDLVLVKDKVLYREVKTEKGRLTREQADWILALRAAGADAGVWRPSDWDALEKELR